MFGRTYKDRNALTGAEIALLAVIEQHGSISTAAEMLGISPRTARNRVDSILEKLCVDTTAQAIEKWRRAA